VVDLNLLSGSPAPAVYTLSGFLTMAPVRRLVDALLRPQFSSWIMTQSLSSWIYFDLPQTYTAMLSSPTVVTATQGDTLTTITYPAAAALTTGCASSVAPTALTLQTPRDRTALSTRPPPTARRSWPGTTRRARALCS